MASPPGALVFAVISNANGLSDYNKHRSAMPRIPSVGQLRHLLERFRPTPLQQRLGSP